MEIRRFYSVCFLKREMRKDLFNIDINNTTDAVSLLFLQLTNLSFYSEYKQINIAKWKKIN